MMRVSNSIIIFNMLRVDFSEYLFLITRADIIKMF